MKTKRSILALGAFFVAVALAVSACGGSSTGDSVAVVAGNPISTQAFKHWMFVAAKGQAAQSPGQPVIVPSDPPQFKSCVAQVRQKIPSLAKTSDKQLASDCKQLFTSLSSQVMDFLIKAYWYQADAHKFHFAVTNAQIQKALAAAKKSQFPTAAQFQTFLQSSGLTNEDVLFRLRVSQLYNKLLAKHPTTVSNAQISSYYQSHLTQFGKPESRDIRIVLTKTQAQARAAKSALQGGSSWTAVVKKFSTDASTRKTGGLLKAVTKGQQDAALNSAAFAAPRGKLGGPVKGQFGFYVYEVTKITKATQQTLAQATPLIKQTLQMQVTTSAQTAVDTQAKKDWGKQTTCKAAYAMADCNGFKAPPAAAAAPTGTGSAAPAPTGTGSAAPAPTGTGSAAPAPTGTTP
jgi:foldase protein PrsA